MPPPPAWVSGRFSTNSANRARRREGKRERKRETCGPALATVGIVSRSSTDREPVPLGRSRRARVPRANLVNELVRTTPLCHRLPGSRRARPMPSSARCGRLDSWGSGGLEQYLSPKKKPRTPSCPPPPPCRTLRTRRAKCAWEADSGVNAQLSRPAAACAERLKAARRTR
jgi:hypothetical protein